MIDTGAVVTSTRSRVGAGDNKERGLRASHGDAAEEEEEDPPLVVADINLGNGVSGAIPVRASDDTTVLAERFIRSHVRWRRGRGSLVVSRPWSPLHASLVYISSALQCQHASLPTLVRAFLPVILPATIIASTCRLRSLFRGEEA
jgi:hypothetical protein